MPTARVGLGVGVVSGVLYAVGGYAQHNLPTLEAYDPATNRWSTKASKPTPGSVAVGVVNGILYAVGGDTASTPASVCGCVSILETYDPTTDRWTTKAPMPTRRTGPGVGVVNGILYAVSGWNGGGVSAAPAYVLEAYDPATNTWTTKRPSWGATGMGVGVANGALYVVGGWSGGEFGRILSALRAYDPLTDTWPSTPWWTITP